MKIQKKKKKEIEDIKSISWSCNRAIVSSIEQLNLVFFFTSDELLHDFIAHVLYCYESLLHNREFMFRFVQLRR